jgi:hypothetical protein
MEFDEGRRGAVDTATPAAVRTLTYDLHKRGTLTLQSGLQRLSRTPSG